MIDEDGVDLVDDRELLLASGELGGAVRQMISQVFAGHLQVAAVRNITAEDSLMVLNGGGYFGHQPGSHSEQAKYVFSLVVANPGYHGVGRDEVSLLRLNGRKKNRKHSHERVAPVIGNFHGEPVMQCSADREKLLWAPVTRRPPNCLPYCGKRFRHDRRESAPASEALAQDRTRLRKLGLAPGSHHRMQVASLTRQGRPPAQVTLLSYGNLNCPSLASL